MNYSVTTIKTCAKVWAPLCQILFDFLSEHNFWVYFAEFNVLAFIDLFILIYLYLFYLEHVKLK